MKFPHLEKFADLIKHLKYEHQSIFPLWGRVKLNFRDRYRKPNIFSKNLSHFSTNCQKMTLWHYWGASCGVLDAPMMGQQQMPHCDGGVATDAPCDCKITLNIDIYPSTLVFLKILAISMILRGLGWYLVGSGGGGWSISREKKF